jgi:uncharacterized protein (TIGR02594 family)
MAQTTTNSEDETQRVIRPPAEQPHWLAIARAEIGVTEAAGDDRDNPRVVEYLSAVVGKQRPWLLRDAIAWCAAFVGWTLAHAGLKGTGSLSAKSYETWGLACELTVGAVVVFRRGLLPWQRHVAFVTSWDETTVHVLGGNQRNRVCVQPRKRVDMTACRWPGPKQLAA